ncbi:hypothetical protein GOP47_0023990 [Adiantum capillus-veneris]|uniref:Uncharacterized protein n=1 Tax=Adiantum capillus-veneris TaxID=13818 RepID=A0A9D4U5K8_ADICA|nr:hypothetical protein GOP47_0023990 [Adiantum capillus-veneris]
MAILGSTSSRLLFLSLLLRLGILRDVFDIDVGDVDVWLGGDVECKPLLVGSETKLEKLGRLLSNAGYVANSVFGEALGDGKALLYDIERNNASTWTTLRGYLKKMH